MYMYMYMYIGIRDHHTWGQILQHLYFWNNKYIVFVFVIDTLQMCFKKLKYKYPFMKFVGD